MVGEIISESWATSIGIRILVPLMGNLVSMAAQFIERQQDIRMDHVESKRELNSCEEARYWTKLPKHAALSAWDIIGQKQLEHSFQFVVGKRASDYGDEPNVLSYNLAHSSLQI
ncbi:hypothetical protein ACVWW6_000233 [Bradyrhizobium sp. USDA 3311]